MRSPIGRRSARIVLAAALFSARLPAAWSQTPAPTLEQQLQDLSRKVEALEKQAPRPSGGGQVVAGPEGLGLRSADGSFSVQLHALVQADARFYGGGTYAGVENSQFLVRRARPILTGTVYGFTSFKVTPEFASNGKTLLYDAFIDVAPWSFARLRAGKFKSPIGLERLQEDAYTTFVERGFPSLLGPQRDTGFQLSGDVPGGLVSYAVAVTNGVADNGYTATATTTADTDSNNGKAVSGRLVFRPFKEASLEPLKGLNVGCGATFAGNVGTSPSYSSPGQNSIFTASANAAADGKQTRLAPELDYYYRSLRVYAEWARSSQVWGVLTAGTNFVNHRTITNQAAQAGVAYVLTGENASYSGVKPAKPFDPKAGTWGAFEVAARYQGLYMDSANFTDSFVTTSARSVRRASGGAVGLNWYWNNFVMMKTNYEYTTFKQGATAGDRLDERFFATRLQLVF